MKLTKSKLKEIIREEMLKEGPAEEYGKVWNKIKKSYGIFWDDVKDLQDLLKNKGMDRDAKKIEMAYKKQVEGFIKVLYKTLGKLQ